MIDHSLLRPNLSRQEFLDGIELAKKYKAATVCVAPYDVKESAELLEGSGVKVSTVIDFPQGSNTTAAKVFQVEEAVRNGASELDMVLGISRLFAGDYEYVKEDVRGVTEKAHELGVPVKVIFENAYLTDEQIEKACQLCEEVGADYVKTSTGYGPSGATLEDVALMRTSCGNAVSVKAAGGVRTLDDLLRYRAAGAKMIGTRSTQPILEEAEVRAKEGKLFEFDDWK
ncbi:MAG: deoxyribose-phosphate aldolase [Chloroflexi bacterium]|nr:MAG: deoxyribose-phosphate aldolase [Chloroflexota bacterium]MBL1193804.1 deoxyribose-phosphate aldolase [Chloroflexota bacterium]NOH11097.1 deoxyribose-phosphate aldolase [Chloroflexota bacterium]